MPRVGPLEPRMLRISTETRRLIAETRVLSGLLEDRRITNDVVLRVALCKHKKTLRNALSKRGFTSEQLSTAQREAVERHTPHSIEHTRFDGAIRPNPVPRVD